MNSKRSKRRSHRRRNNRFVVRVLSKRYWSMSKRRYEIQTKTLLWPRSTDKLIVRYCADVSEHERRCWEGDRSTLQSERKVIERQRPMHCTLPIGKSSDEPNWFGLNNQWTWPRIGTRYKCREGWLHWMPEERLNRDFCVMFSFRIPSNWEGNWSFQKQSRWGHRYDRDPPESNPATQWSPTTETFHSTDVVNEE